MRILIPYTPHDPKSRLEPILSPSERHSFARAMLADVVETVTATGHTPHILADADVPDPPAPVTVDDRSLSTAVNAALEPPMAIAMADLPLMTPAILAGAIDQPADVVIGPGRGGGTNLLVVRSESFSVDYHGMSLSDHRQIARRADLHIEELDSYRVSVDIDEPADLVEVLLHGHGRSLSWLQSHGFEPVATDGRVDIRRR